MMYLLLVAHEGGLVDPGLWPVTIAGWIGLIVAILSLLSMLSVGGWRLFSKMDSVEDGLAHLAEEIHKLNERVDVLEKDTKEVSQWTPRRILESLTLAILTNMLWRSLEESLFQRNRRRSHRI